MSSNGGNSIGLPLASRGNSVTVPSSGNGRASGAEGESASPISVPPPKDGDAVVVGNLNSSNKTDEKLGGKPGIDPKPSAGSDKGTEVTGKKAGDSPGATLDAGKVFDLVDVLANKGVVTGEQADSFKANVIDRVAEVSADSPVAVVSEISQKTAIDAASSTLGVVGTRLFQQSEVVQSLESNRVSNPGDLAKTTKFLKAAFGEQAGAQLSGDLHREAGIDSSKRSAPVVAVRGPGASGKDSGASHGRSSISTKRSGDIQIQRGVSERSGSDSVLGVGFQAAGEGGSAADAEIEQALSSKTGAGTNRVV